MRHDRLKALRIQRGHSQGSLAEMLGMGEKQIWRYENGQTMPDADVVAKIARALNTTTDYLLGLADEQQPVTGDLSPSERALLDAWRRGQLVEAMRVLVGDDRGAS